MNQPAEPAPGPDGRTRQVLAVLTALWMLVTVWLYWRWQDVTSTPAKGPISIVLNRMPEHRWDDFLDFLGVKDLLRFVAAVIAGPVLLAVVAAAGRLRRVAVGYAVLAAVLGVPAAVGTYLYLQQHVT